MYDPDGGFVTGGGWIESPEGATVNGKGDYGFMLTAIDAGKGGSDTFRIQIWEKATGNVVYDNQIGGADVAEPTTAISGGSIVIHQR